MFCDINLEKYKKKHANLSQFELTRLMAKAFSKLSVQNKVNYEIMATQSKEVDPQPEATQSKKDLPQPETSKPVKKSKKVPAKPAAAESPEPSTKKAGKKSKVKAKDDRLEVPRWVPLYKNEPPKPPQLVAPFKKKYIWKFYPILEYDDFRKVVNYYAYLTYCDRRLSKKSRYLLWSKLPKKEKTKYTEMHKQALKDYCVKYQHFVQVSW